MSLRARWRPGDRFLVRHMDASILVVEKQAGLLTVPTPNSSGPDLVHLLREFTRNRRKRNPVFVVHRLDRVVSGLLVFARRRDAFDRLVEQFKEHSVERRYVAAVRGILKKDRGTFKSVLANEPGSLRMSSVDGPSGKGRKAVTHYQVLERFEKANATLVEVRLETGLRNQIRVHFSEAGHPLLGERKYLNEGSEELRRPQQGRQRIFLHAAVLGFVHPGTRKPVRWEAPLPPDLKRWKRMLERGTEATELRPLERRRTRERVRRRR